MGALRVETIDTAEYECHLHVLRLDGEVARIISVTGGGTTVYDPESWLGAVSEYATERGWDSEEEPHVPTAGERAGVHAPTGIPYDPSAAQRIEADAEEFQCRLYREISGLTVEA